MTLEDSKAPTNAIRPEVLERMTFAKSLLRAGEQDCLDTSDKYSFTRGLMLLYDAAEAGLAAISDHIHGQPKSYASILDYYNAIQQKESSKGEIPFKTKMASLTSIRTSAKHHGVLPDPENNKEYSTITRELLRDLAEKYLSLTLEAISLTALIKDSKILKFIKEAEEAYAKGEKRNCMIALAFAAYHIYGHKRMPSSYDAKKRFVYDGDATFGYLYQQLELLSCGVKRSDFHRFHHLTPKIGKDTQTDELFYEFENWLDHEKNWSDRNIRFCIDYCIDAALKSQSHEIEYGIFYSSVYIHRIFPTGDVATIWSMPKEGRNGKKLEREIIKELKKGEVMHGWVSTSDRNDDETMVMSFDLPSRDDDRTGFGFVLKDEISFEELEREKQ